MKAYQPEVVEKKWQEYWFRNNAFRAEENPSKPKFYGLIEFPYPSGAGLHVGHIRAFSSMEVMSRKKRMEGYSVLYPIGYDAFGLPTENYAIQTGEHPKKVTERNIRSFEAQLKSVGYSFDYDRTIDTTDPDYYRWTQWIFLEMFKRGLAYKSKTFVNFCPKCKVVLANEESQNGVCDRCGTEVVQKEKDVWFLKIRDYAERLLEGLNDVDFPEKVKTEQINWIGKSTGAEVTFEVSDGTEKAPLVVYTTRPDTLFGATFLVVSPEHPILERFSASLKNPAEIKAYQDKAKLKKEFERIHMSKEKTGVNVAGLTAVNPVNGERLPIFTADYVMMGYGTGAIMAVPAHDERDHEFAKKFGLPIVEVIAGGRDVQTEPFILKEGGTLVNSGFLNGMTVKEAIPAVIAHLEQRGVGKRKTDYKMKDWAFNRQRYWGEPIPIVNCPHCGQVPLPESELPLTLPDLEDFSPTDDATSPLSRVESWINTTCPVCGAPAKRETDTMPQWAGSSWYYLRYMSPKYDKGAVDPAAYDYWGQVDWYSGGMEHVTRHLIYSRFWNQFLYDIGVVKYPEPYKKRSAHGLILGADGEKMSKSRGNVVNPDDVIKKFGADTLRVFVLFIGDYGMAAPWSEDGVTGARRFLNRVWNLREMVKETDGAVEVNLDAAVKKVSEDIDTLKFNTAIAQLMTVVNGFYQRGSVKKAELSTFLKLLYPFAPHIAEEMYCDLNGGEILSSTQWPSYDPKKLYAETSVIPVQINGKIKGKLTVPRGAEQSDVLKEAEKLGFLDGRTVKKVIFVKDRILNLVTAEPK